MTLGSFVPAGGGSTPPPAGDLEPLRAEIIARIYDHDRNRGRSLQREIGASQVGVPCGRQLVYLATHRQGQSHSDPWPAIVGTALHSHCDEVFRDHPEWLTDVPLRIGPMPGRADLYHLPTATMIDLKFPGDTSFRGYASHQSDDPYWWRGLGSQYRVQLQCYGAGAVTAGLPVRRVALFVAGKAKPLPRAVMVGWDYDPAVSRWALERRAFAYQLAGAGVDPRAVPAAPESTICHFCPFRGPDSRGLCDEGKTR